MQVVCVGEILELLGFGAGRMLQDQSLELVNRVEKVDTAAAIRVSRLEEPHVVPVVQRRAHRHCRRLSLLLTHLVVLLNALVHLTKYLLLTRLIFSIEVLVSELFHHIVVISELIELMLT